MVQEGTAILNLEAVVSFRNFDIHYSNFAAAYNKKFQLQLILSLTLSSSLYKFLVSDKYNT